MTADRTLLYVGGGILALVVIVAAAVIVLGSGRSTDFPADTPEGVVQRHLAALEDDDYETAWGYFSSDVRAELDLDAYRRAVREYGFFPFDTSRRILLDRTEIDGDRARVLLTVEEFYQGGPFGGGETYRSSREITLVREGAEWRIDDPIIGLEPAPIEPF